jgi:hypothetical protein
VQTDDILGGLAVRGYGATGFSGGQGQVMFRAAEPWTDAAHGTYLQFTTTPIGGAAWTERMRIAPYGYVGLGTATPLFPLDASMARGNTIAKFGGSGAPLFAMAGEPRIGFNLYYEGAYKYGASTYGGYLGFNQTGDGAFTFATAPAGVVDATVSPVVRMSVTNSGQVAIGNHTPTQALDVQGSILASASVSGNFGLFSTTGSGSYAVRAHSLGTGVTRGVEGTVSSASGTAGLFTNTAATGRALSGVVNGIEVMHATETGIHAGPGMTGTPLAFGTVRSNGVWLTQSRSSNVLSVNRTATGQYQIVIANESLNYTIHSVAVTMIADVGFGFISYEFVSNNLFVFTTSTTGTAADRSFSFIIMKD